MIHRFSFGLVPLLLALTAACSQGPQPRQNAGQSGLSAINPALESLSSDDLLRHTRVLASDEYEGRAPGTRGEELSVKYLTEQFQKLGLKPGNPDGSFVQKVPLAGFTPESQASIVAGKEMLSLKPQTDYVAVCRRTVPEVKVENQGAESTLAMISTLQHARALVQS